jgi:hypothetical protein
MMNVVQTLLLLLLSAGLLWLGYVLSIKWGSWIFMVVAIPVGLFLGSPKFRELVRLSS